MNAESSPLLDQSLVDEIRQVERATGKHGLFVGFVQKLEEDLTTFARSIGASDASAAAKAAHKLKGACRQLGVAALGDLFAQVEAAAKAGDQAEALRRFAGG